jgi:hypothetical protein
MERDVMEGVTGMPLLPAGEGRRRSDDRTLEVATSRGRRFECLIPWRLVLRRERRKGGEGLGPTARTFLTAARARSLPDLLLPPPGRGSEDRLQETGDLVRLGAPARDRLVVDSYSIELDSEDAMSSRPELNSEEHRSPALEHFRRHTDGVVKIVSRYAVRHHDIVLRIDHDIRS